MLTDIEIAQSCVMQPIEKIADTLGLTPDLLEPYGRYKAKVDYLALKDRPQKGRLVLVTAINPTPAGEGKTTVSIGLADALRLEGYNACLALREPSLGPVFGVKGGAAGGGYAQVVPMEDINLHFTGDMHAITAANNLIAAMVDNSIQQGNPLGIDPRRVTWKRCMDMNDRQLRNILDGLGGKPNGTPREDGFDITTASEIMATLCLASSIADLKARIARIVVARTYDDKPVTAGDIHAQGAATALLKDALRPNLVQTLIGTPAFVHGGPFANIAHGCNTVIATQTALRLADVVVTEAGFGPARSCAWRRFARSRATAAWPKPTSARRTSKRWNAASPICAAICATSARSGGCIRWSRSTALRPIPTRKSSWCAVRRRKPARKSRSARFGRRAARAAVSWPGW